MAITRSAARPRESPKRSRSSIYVIVDDCSDSESENERQEEEESINTMPDNPTPLAGFSLSDSDVLSCPICTDPLTIPVYQCENGHFSCGTCRDMINDKCPSCRKPIGNKRCRGMENVIESIKTACQNFEHGCWENLSYSKKLQHENSCEYTPIPCPHPRCNYIGMAKSFYDHYVENHPGSCKLIAFNTVNWIYVGEGMYLLVEEKEKTVFYVNRITDPVGSFVCVSTAMTSSNVKFAFDLTAGSGERSVGMKSFVETAPKGFAKPAKEKCLLITKNIHPGASDEDSMFPLQVVIRKASL